MLSNIGLWNQHRNHSDMFRFRGYKLCYANNSHMFYDNFVQKYLSGKLQNKDKNSFNYKELI